MWNRVGIGQEGRGERRSIDDDDDYDDYDGDDATNDATNPPRIFTSKNLINWHRRSPG